MAVSRMRESECQLSAESCVYSLTYGSGYPHRRKFDAALLRTGPARPYPIRKGISGNFVWPRSSYHDSELGYMHVSHEDQDMSQPKRGRGLLSIRIGSPCGHNYGLNTRHCICLNGLPAAGFMACTNIRDHSPCEHVQLAPGTSFSAPIASTASASTRGYHRTRTESSQVKPSFGKTKDWFDESLEKGHDWDF
jgi:hypothetical protein